jgi:hypothetical protein
MQKIGQILILLSLLTIGCLPEELPKPTSSDAAFEVSGELDGVPLSLAAGQDSRYMFTSVGADDNGVLQFRGTLGTVGCENCAGSLGFLFSQAANSTDINTLLNDSLQWRGRNDNTHYLVNFRAHLSGTPPFSMNWYFGDGNSAVTTDAVIQHEYTTAGEYEVCVQIVDAAGCSSELCRYISTDNVRRCNTLFSINQLPLLPDSLHFMGLVAGQPPFDYLWTMPLGNGQTAYYATASLLTKWQPLDFGVVRLQVEDATGCRCSIAQTVNFNDPTEVCIRHFDYRATPKVVVSTAIDYFSTLEIKYIDAYGTVFSSALGAQPSFATLNILGAEAFEQNTNGEPTQRVTLAFSCRLFDGNGNFKDLKNVEGTIAVAHL